MSFLLDNLPILICNRHCHNCYAIYNNKKSSITNNDFCLKIEWFDLLLCGSWLLRKTNNTLLSITIYCKNLKSFSAILTMACWKCRYCSQVFATIWTSFFYFINFSQESWGIDVISISTYGSNDSNIVSLYCFEVQRPIYRNLTLVWEFYGKISKSIFTVDSFTFVIWR